MSRVPLGGRLMSALRTIPRLFLSNWNVKSLLALPIFITAMWYGIAHQFDTFALYAVALGLASWEIASCAVHVIHKWQEWQTSRRGEFEVDGVGEGDEGDPPPGA
jgi:hypothetical protein